MPSANLILFNASITAGGTQQALDPNGTENLTYAQTAIVKALSTNTGTVYIQTVSGAGATTGFPLAAGEQVPLLIPNTGLFVNGTTTSDKYAVAAS